MTRRTGVVAVALALLAGLAAPAAAQEADPSPTIVVTPADDLVDGQLVTVEGAGWPPGDTFHQLEISVCPADEDRCDRVDTGFEAEVDGTFHREVRVRTIARARDGTVTDCRSVPCHLLVGERYSTPQVPAPLDFDADAPLLADPVLTVTPDHDLIFGQSVTLHGTGFFPNEALLETACTPGIDPYSCYGVPVVADASGTVDLTTVPAIFQLQWHGGYDCRQAPFCSFYLLDPADRVVRASAREHLRPDGDEAVTVTPADDLPESATVTVDATGLNEGYDGWVAQCWHDPAFDVLPNGAPWATCGTERMPFSVGPSESLFTTVAVQRWLTVTPYSGGTVTIDCAVDPGCNVSVGGDAVDALLHNGMGDREARVEIPITFAGAAPAATPTAVTPAFTG